MFHGRKRTDKKELSEAELKEVEAKLEKISKNNKTLLSKRANKEYDIQMKWFKVEQATGRPGFSTSVRVKELLQQQTGNQANTQASKHTSEQPNKHPSKYIEIHASLSNN